MKKCEKCNVFIAQGVSVCPLCGSKLSEVKANPSPTEQEEQLYPDYKSILDYKEPFPRILRIFLMISIIIDAACLLINLLTSTAILWSIMVIAGNLLLWILVGLPLWSDMHVNKMLIIQMVASWIFILLIDSLTDNTGWAAYYLVPLLYVTIALTVLILSFVQKSIWHENLYLLILVVVIGIALFLLRLLFTGSVQWTYWIAFLFALLLGIGIIIFTGKKSFVETRKHIDL